MKHEQSPIALPAEILAVVGAAAKKDHREILRGVHVFTAPEGRVVAEATDGKILLRATVKRQPDEDDPGREKIEGVPEFNVTLPKKAVKMAAEVSKGDHAFNVWIGDDGQVVVRDIGNTESYEGTATPQETGKYPDIEAVLPGPRLEVTVDLSVELAKRFFEGLHKGGVRTVKLHVPHEYGKMILATAGDAEDQVEWLGVLMPRKESDAPEQGASPEGQTDEGAEMPPQRVPTEQTEMPVEVDVPEPAGGDA